MPSLLELQQDFMNALFEATDGAIARAIHDDGRIEPALRIAIYRNNLHSGFESALALGFPVLKRLVGDDYFRQTARAFQRAFPSRSGDLHHIGGALPEYLRQCFAATQFTYLPDVAALEWAIEQVMVAESAPPLTVTMLAGIDPARYEHVVFEPRACCRLVRSQFPVVRIWLANQPDATDEIVNLDSGPDHVAVVRAAGGLEFRRLPPADFTLAQMLSGGMSLGLAADAALACDADFDLGTALTRLLAAEIFACAGVRC
jgi:hypothetical protein